MAKTGVIVYNIVKEVMDGNGTGHLKRQRYESV